MFAFHTSVPVVPPSDLSNNMVFAQGNLRVQLYVSAMDRVCLCI